MKWGTNGAPPHQQTVSAGGAVVPGVEYERLAAKQGTPRFAAGSRSDGMNGRIVSPRLVPPSGNSVNVVWSAMCASISRPARTTSRARSRSTNSVPVERARKPIRGQPATSDLARNREESWDWMTNTST